MRTAKNPNARPLTQATAERLFTLLDAKYPDKVWRVIEVCPVAVVKTIDNEDDALQTIANFERL